eukprot:1134812-Lingulodinium_polyedra.AAC.1
MGRGWRWHRARTGRRGRLGPTAGRRWAAAPRAGRNPPEQPASDHWRVAMSRARDRWPTPWKAGTWGIAL